MSISVGWSLAIAGLLAQASPAPPPTTTFTLRISIANGPDGQPVARRDWLDAQIATAQELFAPFGVAFAPSDGPPLDARSAPIETRADRDALAAHVAQHVVDLFVVSSLLDVDEPGRPRRGVHWHAPGGAHYVILIGTAPPTVLAHELGHYFGNPHSHVPDNVMSYERTGARVFFDADQGRRIKARARAYVQSGELLPAAP